MKAEKVKTAAKDVPLLPITIEDCGELTGEDKLTEEAADFLSNYTDNKAEELRLEQRIKEMERIKEEVERDAPEEDKESDDDEEMKET